MRCFTLLYSCLLKQQKSLEEEQHCFVESPEDTVAESNVGRCLYEYHNCDMMAEAYRQSEAQVLRLTEEAFQPSRDGCRVMSTWNQGVNIQNAYGDEAQRVPMFELGGEFTGERIDRPLLITEVEALSNGDECIDEQYLSTDGETAMAIVETSGIAADNLSQDPDYQFDPFQLGWSTDLCRSLMLSKIAFDFQELGYPPTIESSCWVDSEGTPEQLSDLSVVVFTRYRYTLEEGDPFMLLQHAVDNALFYSENYDGGVPQERLSRISELAESECP